MEFNVRLRGSHERSSYGHNWSRQRPLADGEVRARQRGAQNVALSLSWRLRGRPTDGPLKKAPFSKYVLLKRFSTYSCGVITEPCTTNEYPPAALKIVFGET